MKKGIRFFDKETLKTGVRDKKGIGFLVSENAKVEELFYNGMDNFRHCKRDDLDFEVIYDAESLQSFKG